MITSVSHIALYVPDLQAAENFYKNLFDMELIGREVEKEGGLWYTLPFDKDWDSVKAAGIELGMSALGKGGGLCWRCSGAQIPLVRYLQLGWMRLRQRSKQSTNG